MFFWWLAIVFTLALNISKLLKLKKQLRAIQIMVAKEPEQKPEFEAKLRNIRVQKNAAVRNLVKCIGDLFPSSAGWGALKRTHRRTGPEDHRFAHRPRRSRLRFDCLLGSVPGQEIKFIRDFFRSQTLTKLFANFRFKNCAESLLSCAKLSESCWLGFRATLAL